MRIGIIGAGPAGAQLGWKMATAGAEVSLFDARPEPWEKPCGGGVTSKALREFDFLRQPDARKQMVSDVRIISNSGRELSIRPKSDFGIFSRRELDRFMRDRALRSGVRFENARIASIERQDTHWTLTAQDGRNFECDFLVGADGATSKTRKRLGFDFSRGDFIYALGWHVRQPRSKDWQSRVEIKYLDNTMGYIWAFPRTDHLSFGIASKYQERNPAWLRATLLDYIAEQDPVTATEIRNSGEKSSATADFYGAMIPALEPVSWDKLVVSSRNDNWALIGDAAGFVDPLTGEGIYYAIRSAELLAESLLEGKLDFESRWRGDFGEELRYASRISERFYLGAAAGAPVTERMIQLARFHRGIRDTLNDLIAGDQGYLDLKPRLLRSAIRVF